MSTALKSQTPGTEITDADYRTPQFRINEANYQITAQLSMASDALSALMHCGVPVHSIAMTAAGAHLKTGPARNVPGLKEFGWADKTSHRRVRASLHGCVIEWEEFV